MAKQYQYSDFFNQDVQSGMKKLHDMMVATDKVIKNIKIAPSTGEGLKTINAELKKTEGYFKSLHSLRKQRERQEKAQLRIDEKKIKQAEKFNLILVQRKAKEQALVNEIRKRAREEEKLKREMLELGVLAKKEIKSDKELIRYNNLLVQQRKNMVVATKAQRKEYNLLTRQIAKNEVQIRKTDASIGRFQRNVGNYASRFKGLMGTLGLAGGAFMLVRGIKNIAKIFSGFAKDLSKLQAVAGVDKDISSLEIQAKKLGGTTVFTSRQILGLQTELAKLGFTVPEIVDATEGIQGLAAATGADLSAAATLAGSTLKIFDLAMSESTRVADVLALSTSKTALDMEKLAIALPIVGTSAKIAGKDLEWTVSRLGLLVDRGIQASTAGTALRKIFAELSKKGISYADAMDKINNSTDKAKTAIDIFGIRAKDAAIILAENSEAANDLEIAFDGAAGSAKAMADVMLDNLSGDITLAQSAWERFVTSIEDGSGAISEALRSVVTGFTNVLTSMSETNMASDVLNRKFNMSFWGKDAWFHPSRYKDLGNLVIHLDKVKSSMSSLSEEAQKATFNQLAFNLKSLMVQLTQAKTETEIRFLKNKIVLYRDYMKEIYKTRIEQLKNKTIIKTKDQEEIERLNEIIKLQNKKTKTLSDRALREGSGIEGIKNIALGGDIGKAKTDLDKDIKEIFVFAKTTLNREYTSFQTFLARLKFGSGTLIANLLGIDDDELEEIKQQVVEAFNKIMSLRANQLDAQRAANDEILSMADQRIDKLNEELEAEEDQINKLKEAGQAFSSDELQRIKKDLADQQQLKQKALLEDKKIKEKQKAQDLVQGGISIASGILRALSLTPPYSYILAAITATLGAIQLAQIKSASYAQGTRYLQLGGNPDGTDTVPIMADRGERILSRKTNAKIDRNFSNELIPDAIQFYKDGQSEMPIMNLHDYSHDYSYIKEVAENTRDKGRVYNRDGKLIREQNGNVITFF